MASLRLKNGLFGVAEACQINAFSRCLCGQSLAVLCYHGVVTADRSSDRVLYGNTVSVAEFESQLEYVAKHFNALSAAERALKCLATYSSWDSNSATLTVFPYSTRSELRSAVTTP